MMKSGSMSRIHHNNSISDSNSKKSMTRQKTNSMLQTLPYTISQNVLSTGSTRASTIPTIAMFNSIINSHKNLKTRKKTSSRKKNRGTVSPSSYSKFRNTFLSMYDYSSPAGASRSKNSGPPTTNEALKLMLSNKKSAIH